MWGGGGGGGGWQLDHPEIQSAQAGQGMKYEVVQGK